jgi:putative ABC transport system ATP-binding protein
MTPVIKVSSLNKSFQTAEKKIDVLIDISFEINAQSTSAIIGPSGSGKTTLLGLCAALDEPSSGKIEINSIDISTLSEDQKARFRNEQIGFVFQNFQLMPTLTALENVMLPAELLGRFNPLKPATELLDQVGLTDRLDHYPVQLSGGEQQRVALARAFINEPAILFADEPTGNLDAETSEKIIQLLFDLNAKKGTTLVLVTHNMELAQMTSKIIRLKGGRIAEEKFINQEEVLS